MEETSVTVIGIVIAVVIMLVVPLVLIADRTDDIAQLVVQNAVAEFVDDVIKTGQITSDRYQRLVYDLQSSGNVYDIDMEVKILDENTAKKVTDEDFLKIGSNIYYSIFTSQIEEKIAETNTNGIGKLILKQGDEISITVKNSSKTLSQTLKSFYYNAAGSDIHIIVATASGTVAIDGRASGI